MMQPAFVMAGAERQLGQMAAIEPMRSKAHLDRVAGLFWLDELGGEGDLYDVVSGVALIPVQGMLINCMGYGGARWATGYNVLQLQLEQAFSSPRVRGIALDVNSPGGLVDGCLELMAWIHERKAASGKPLIAIVNSIAASAAYGIASTADQIACPPLGAVGSIGVKMTHVEYDDLYKQAGIGVTDLFWGAFKNDGSENVKLSARAAEEFKTDLAEIGERLCAAIAVGRGSAGFDAAAAAATEAYFYRRPSKIEEALALGMIDAIARPDEALTAFVDAVSA